MNVRSGSVGVGGEDGDELATNLAAEEDAACSLAALFLAALASFSARF